MENHQGEIFYLYKVQNKTAKEVIQILESQYGLDVSRKMLNTQLKKWGFFKNIKKDQAIAISREKDDREARGKDFDFNIQFRPADLQRVIRYVERANFSNEELERMLHSSSTASAQVTCRTPPPVTSISLLREEQWRIPEKLFFDIDRLIKASFEAGHWSWNGKDQIIYSSNDQFNERTLLHSFLGSLSSGCEAADANNFALAGHFWEDAFSKVDCLVQGKYHDIIPNLVQKINDLNAEGRSDLARMLQNHIATCGQWFLGSSDSTVSIYIGLGQMNMAHMIAFEEGLMRRFNELFEQYLGPLSYNSFVTMMNQARRRLYRDEFLRLEDVLPPVDHLDRIFGVTDRRSIDVIGLRIEIAHRRKWLALVETEAPILISRAKMIKNDDWQRFYNLTRGWYDLGCAQYFLQKKGPAIFSFNNAIASDDSLDRVEKCNIFDPQKITMAKYLQDMENWP